MSRIDFQPHGSDWSWAAMRNFLDAAAVSWLCRAALCVGVAVLTHWGIGHNQAFSPRLLTPAISCEIWKDFSLRSHWRADSCCRGSRVGSNLHRNMSRSVVSSVKLCWSRRLQDTSTTVTWVREERGWRAVMLHRFYSSMRFLLLIMARHQSEAIKRLDRVLYCTSLHLNTSASAATCSFSL